MSVDSVPCLPCLSVSGRGQLEVRPAPYLGVDTVQRPLRVNAFCILREINNKRWRKGGRCVGRLKDDSRWPDISKSASRRWETKKEEDLKDIHIQPPATHAPHHRQWVKTEDDGRSAGRQGGLPQPRPCQRGTPHSRGLTGKGECGTRVNSGQTEVWKQIWVREDVGNTQEKYSKFYDRKKKEL